MRLCVCVCVDIETQKDNKESRKLLKELAYQIITNRFTKVHSFSTLITMCNKRFRHIVHK